MSNYRGRTGPNVSQYLNGLNTLSPADYVPNDDNDLSNELAMYTNTDFTNLDSIPSIGEEGPFNFDLATETPIQDNFNYEELLADTSIPTEFGSVLAPVDQAPPTQPQSFFSSYNTPIQPAPTGGFPVVEQANQSSLPGSVRSSRSGTQSATHVPAEEKARLAAEEDKRRRNTAASARFRVKKKQREQALEKTLKEVQDKNGKLEARLSQLEMENKWLKDLITEKNGLSSKEEIVAAYERHRKESEERVSKTEPAHTSGIGTEEA